MKKKDNLSKEAKNEDVIQESEQVTQEPEVVQETVEDSCCKEVEELKAQLEQKTKQCGEYFEKLQRSAAEFDNFKKRTAKEKEALYSDATSDVVSAFLPIVDNLERALDATKSETEANGSLKAGVELVYRQLQEVLKKLGVEAINAVENEFDPNLHDAVFHVDDEQYGNNIVVEEFQKGYIHKGKVIRHSMVKVAN